MGLKDYRKKRNFSKTSEPSSGKIKAGDRIFVVQKHFASNLHYDFRLQAFGTLKSWAVPKGPSTIPGDKRLAVEVEDHPVSYASFQGTIPEGEYGAGEVEIWDHGKWIPKSPLKSSLREGHLEFELQGERLKGLWLLQRTAQKSGKQNQWLLIKRTDKKIEKKTSPKVVRKRKADPFPSDASPQLAKLTDRAPVGPQWIYELKLDGYRTFIQIQKNSIKFITRNGHDWTTKYSELVKNAKSLKVQSTLLDGEIMAAGDDHSSSFSSLQKVLKNGAAHGSLQFCAFDLLYLNGEDLREKPLEERKLLLKKLIPKGKEIVFSDHVRTPGQELLRQACAQGYEGIIAKDRTQPYRSGRNDLWQKVKCSKKQEFVVGGYTLPEGTRSKFGALLVGTYEMGSAQKLKYLGRVGTGFKDHDLDRLFGMMEKLKTEKNPFEVKVPGKGIQFIQPKLVVEVDYKMQTSEGILRHSSFQGLREDKDARDVHLDIPEKALSTSAKKKAGFTISSPERLIYEKQNITKLQVAHYYKSVTPWLMPYLKDRPLAVLRCPESTSFPCFYQKHIQNSKMNNIIEKQIQDQKVMFIDSAEGLLELIQYGSIELHTWQCQMNAPDYPDQIVFDFDPDPLVKWSDVIKTALRFKDLLERIQLKSFVKTTGGKGLHVHVPVLQKYSWDAIKAFSKTVCRQIESEYPKLYTVQMSKQKRSGKIFLDYLRNGFGSTAIAPYSLRAKARATAAVPLAWKELGTLKSSDGFDLHSTLERLASERQDPWKDYFKLKQRIGILDGKP